MIIKLSTGDIVEIKKRLFKVTYTPIYDTSKKDNRGKRPNLKLLTPKDMLKLIRDLKVKDEMKGGNKTK